MIGLPRTMTVRGWADMSMSRACELWPTATHAVLVNVYLSEEAASLHRPLMCILHHKSDHWHGLIIWNRKYTATGITQCLDQPFRQKTHSYWRNNRATLLCLPSSGIHHQRKRSFGVIIYEANKQCKINREQRIILSEYMHTRG